MTLLNRRIRGYLVGLVVGVLWSSTAFASTDWAMQMTQSEMARNPKAWQIEGYEKPKWNYTQGLVLLAMTKVYERQPDAKIFAYIKDYADTLIDERGDIKGYRMDKYNIDMINAGKILFFLYEHTHDPRYIKAMHIMRKQLADQPRTSEGGFWHKKIYPFQMWLDGLYMGTPFYTQYAVWFSEGTETFDDIANQFAILQRHAKDEKTGLLYHGWDESRQQQWSNPETGVSPHFWGRSLGWYAMALADVLEYFPKGHPRRGELEGYFNDFAEAVSSVQDQSGLWYQVPDLPDRKGNYLEGSASSMLVYALAKGVRLGVLDEKYQAVAEKGYQGLLDKLIVKDGGEISITQVCAVAGLGGKPYRDGSFEYYINEKKRDNDPKATGPFILASLELQDKF